MHMHKQILGKLSTTKAIIIIIFFFIISSPKSLGIGGSSEGFLLAEWSGVLV